MDAIHASVTSADMVAKSFQLPVRETLDSGVTWAGPYTMTYTVADNGGNTDFTWTVTNGLGATVDTDTTAYADAIEADDVVLGLKVLGLAAVSASLTVADFPATFTIPCGVYDWGARDGSGPLLNPPYQIVGTATVDGGDIDFAWDVKDGASTTIGSGIGTHASATEAHVASDEMLTDCRVEIEAQDVITDVTTASFDIETPELPFVPTQAPISVSACGILNTPNRTYQLTADVSSDNGECLDTSGAQNIAIDLNGHTVTFVDGPWKISAGVNDKLDFTEGTSGAAVATITPGNYITSTLMRTEIQTQMNAVATDNTYSLTYNTGTHFFTIARATGTDTISLNWSTGPNSSDTIAGTIGYNVSDDTGATSYTSDNLSWGVGRAVESGGANYVRVYNGTFQEGAFDPGGGDGYTAVTGRHSVGISGSVSSILVAENITCNRKDGDTSTRGACFIFAFAAPAYFKAANNVFNMTGDAFAWAISYEAGSGGKSDILFNYFNIDQVDQAARNGGSVNFTGWDATVQGDHKIIGNDTIIGANTDEANMIVQYQSDNGYSRDNTVVLNGQQNRGILWDSGSAGSEASYTTIVANMSVDNGTGIRIRNSGLGNHVHHISCEDDANQVNNDHGCFYVAANGNQSNPVVIRNSVISTTTGFTGIKFDTEGGTTDDIILFRNSWTAASGWAIWFRGLAGDIQRITVQEDSISGSVRFDDTVGTTTPILFCNTTPTTPTLEGQISEGGGTHDFTIQAEDCWP
jgi:hypothetical protein